MEIRRQACRLYFTDTYQECCQKIIRGGKLFDVLGGGGRLVNQIDKFIDVQSLCDLLNLSLTG